MFDLLSCEKSIDAIRKATVSDILKLIYQTLIQYSTLKSKPWNFAVKPPVCVQTGAVFKESPAGRKGSGKRNTRRSLLSKVQRRMQRKTDEDFVTEGGEGLARSTTLPW